MSFPFVEKLFGTLNKFPFFITGPCVIESEELNLKVAYYVKDVASKLNITVIYKSSFDKANRTSINSYRGMGIKEGLRILNKIKKETGLPILTDIHEPWQAEEVAEVVDVIQIPAFLSRQTDLLVAAGKTNLPINIKKGQFLSAEDMKYQLDKVLSTGNNKVALTERGTFFGYNNLVVDFRSIEIMKSFGVPVVYDATHSVQIPGGGKGKSSGRREFILPLSKAAAAVGADGFFFEIHPDPENALSDGPNSLFMEDFENVVKKLGEIYEVSK